MKTIDDGQWALRLPGLEHRLRQAGTGAAAALFTLAETSGGALVGDQVWGRATTADGALAHAMAFCSREVDGLGVAAAVGVGESLWHPAHGWFGLEAMRLRRMLDLGRVGECALTPDAFAVAELPEGVGAFAAPQALQDALGHPVHLLRDYR